MKEIKSEIDETTISLSEVLKKTVSDLEHIQSSLMIERDNSYAPESWDSLIDQTAEVICMLDGSKPLAKLQDARIRDIIDNILMEFVGSLSKELDNYG